MRFDPDYCDGGLGYDVLGDLSAEGRDRRDFQRAKGFVSQARPPLESLGRFCKAHRHDLIAAAGSEDFRIARIAVHLDLSGPGGVGLHGLLADWDLAAASDADEASVVAAASRVLEALGEATKRKETYARRLLAVRTHHELTRLTRQGYADLVEALAYGPQEEEGQQNNEVH